MAIEAESVAALYEQLKRRLADVYPDAELFLKAELAYEINRLKKEKNALILGHNYMEPALYHAVPDLVGDSLELARRAAETDRPIIVFLGVHFMAETAKILNPDKTVLIPALGAGCSLAESLTADDVRRLKAAYPGAPVVAYVNTSAEVKAESDICCTSSNAARVVASLDAETVIFIPDQYLAANVAREVPDKTIVAWPGRCIVHEKFSVEDVAAARRQFPDVVVLAHPECPPDVVAAADFSGSTAAMIRFVREHPARRLMLLTECAMGDNIAAENPDKEIVRLSCHRCPYMQMITLEATLEALRELRYPVEVPEPVRSRARRALERMLAIA
ncbi:MAG: quinolinate synthase NadA [Hydrogenibacillus schlegelii]|nr:quinolinate synthase NadA [Hydrogenibacillus schlegelii]